MEPEAGIAATVDARAARPRGLFEDPVGQGADAHLGQCWNKLRKRGGYGPVVGARGRRAGATRAPQEHSVRPGHDGPLALRPAGAEYARNGGFTARPRRRLLAYEAVDFLSTPPGRERARRGMPAPGPRAPGPGRRPRPLPDLCPCAHGVIPAVTIDKPFHDAGLGARTLSHLRARHPGIIRAPPGITWLGTSSTGVEDDLLLRMRVPAPPPPRTGLFPHPAPVA